MSEFTMMTYTTYVAINYAYRWNDVDNHEQLFPQTLLELPFSCIAHLQYPCYANNPLAGYRRSNGTCFADSWIAIVST